MTRSRVQIKMRSIPSTNAAPPPDAVIMAPEILRMGAQTMEQRAASRGTERERNMARTVAIFNAATDHQLSELDGWKFMQALKMARSHSPIPNLDDYIDGAAYAALAGECAVAKVQP